MFRSAHDWISTRVVPSLLFAATSFRSRSVAEWAEFRRGIKFRQSHELWSDTQKLDWQRLKLAEVLIAAYEGTHFYRNRFDAVGFDPYSAWGWSDFARIPPLRRAEIQHSFDELQLPGIRKALRRFDATGGSTGEPLRIVTGPEERAWRASGADYSMRKLGVGLGVRRAMLWGHHLDIKSEPNVLSRLADLSRNRKWLNCMTVDDATLHQFHLQLIRYRPQVLVAYASVLSELAEMLARNGSREQVYPSKCIVTGAEKLYDHHRDLAGRVFGVPVHERYGGRDLGDIAFQYHPDRTSDFDVDWSLVAVEPESREVETGVLVTKLRADAMPLIRYSNDDHATFESGSIPGRPVMRIAQILGRLTDRITLADGRRVNALQFPHLLKDFAVLDFEVIQSANSAVNVTLVQRDVRLIEELPRLRVALEGILGRTPFNLEIVDRIPKLAGAKWRPVRSDYSALDV